MSVGDDKFSSDKSLFLSLTVHLQLHVGLAEARRIRGVTDVLTWERENDTEMTDSLLLQRSSIIHFLSFYYFL